MQRAFFRSAVMLAAIAVSGMACAQSKKESNDTHKSEQKAKVRVSHSSGITMPGNYWIGVVALPVSPAVRAQVHLPEGQGLQVFTIHPDSPAKKAGLKEYDILLKAGGQPLARIPDLMAAVEKAKEKNLVLEDIRGGKPMNLVVTPVKRPENLREMEGFPGQIPEGERQAFQHWLEQMPEHPGMHGPMQFHMFGPGAILSQLPPWPAHTTVTVIRNGEGPAKICVRQGDKKWDVTEANLGELPPDIRLHLERMLHPMPPMGPDGRPLPPPERPLGPPPGMRRHGRPEGRRMEDRFEERRHHEALEEKHAAEERHEAEERREEATEHRHHEALEGQHEGERHEAEERRKEYRRHHEAEKQHAAEERHEAEKRHEAEERHEAVEKREAAEGRAVVIMLERMHMQIEEMSHRIETLHKQVEELQEHHNAAPAVKSKNLKK